MPLLRVEIKRLYVMYCTSHSFFFQRRRGERKSARCVDAAAFIEIDLTSASDIDLYDEQRARAVLQILSRRADVSQRQVELPLA